MFSSLTEPTSRHGRPALFELLDRPSRGRQGSGPGNHPQVEEDGKTIGWKAENGKATSGVLDTHRDAVEWLLDPKPAPSRAPRKRLLKPGAKASAAKSAPKSPAPSEAAEKATELAPRPPRTSRPRSRRRSSRRHPAGSLAPR